MTTPRYYNIRVGVGEVYRDLREMGHRIGTNVGSFGGYQGIMLDWENKVYYGASESRKDGQAAGY